MARRRSTSSRKRRGSGFQLSTGAALLLLVVVAAIYFFLDQSEPSANQPTGSGQDSGASTANGAIEVFFTTPALIYPDRATTRRPAPIEQAIIADIDAAASSIEMATFEYNLLAIAEALVRAKQRGVDVRMALDRENLEKPEMAAFAGQLEDASIPIAWEDSDAFLHSKFVIVDSKFVWMGSWNATINDTYRNNNNLLRISVPEIVQNYAAEFAQMEQGRFANQKEPQTPNPRLRVSGIPVGNYFSPQDGVRQHVVEQLRNAQSNIRFLAFSYTSDDIGQAMIDRHGAGVSVQGVFEQRNAGGQGAEFDALRAGGVDVLEDGNCYTMHHKLIIIDDRVVITGSYNFTARAEDTNDENLIIIEDPALAQQFLAEYERVYGQAVNPTRCQS